jgi:hypothetical protein
MPYGISKIIIKNGDQWKTNENNRQKTYGMHKFVKENKEIQ